MTVLPNVSYITNSADPRVSLYRNLRDHALAKRYGLFLVEGEFLIKRTLDSDYEIESVFVSQKRLPRISAWIPENMILYTASEDVLSEIVGFHFHRGVLALVRRKSLLTDETFFKTTSEIKRVLVLPEINNAENLGLILRSAAGLGFSCVLLGPSCCDPFSRRALRTGMGASLRLVLIQCCDLQTILHRLHDRNMSIHAAALTDHAYFLHEVQPPEKVALVLGPEAYGLPEWILHQSDCIVKIPMQNETDSLNVGVAAGILMYHYAGMTLI